MIGNCHRFRPHESYGHFWVFNFAWPERMALYLGQDSGVSMPGIPPEVELHMCPVNMGLQVVSLSLNIVVITLKGYKMSIISFQTKN